MTSEISLFGCHQPGVSPGLPRGHAYPACVPHLTLCVLWLVNDRASCSEGRAIWEPYLRTSASFLPRGDMAALDVYTPTKKMPVNLQKHVSAGGGKLKKTGFKSVWKTALRWQHVKLGAFQPIWVINTSPCTVCTFMHITYITSCMWRHAFCASTLPVVWVRWGHGGAFTGGAEITVVPLMGGERVCRSRGTVSLSLRGTTQVTSVTVNTDFMHLRQLRHGYGLVCWPTRVNVMWILICEVKENKNHKCKVTSKLNVAQKAGKEFSHAVGKHSHDSTAAAFRQIRSCLLSPFSLTVHSCLASLVEPLRVETSSS